MKPGLVARLMLAYGAVIAAVVVSALRSQHALAQAEESARVLSERSIQGIQLAAQLEALTHERGYVSNYMLSGDRSYLAEASPHHQQLEGWIEQMDGFARTDTERGLVAQMRTEYLAYTAKGDEVVRLWSEGQTADAERLFFAMKRDVEALVADGQRLFAAAEQDMRARRAQTDAVITRQRQVTFWLTLVGAVTSLGVGFLLARYAAAPLYKLVVRLGEAGGVDQFQFKGDEVGALESHVNALLERVRGQERALQQAEKLSELGEIAAEIAHETLNPLAGVKGMLQALRRRPVSPERLAAELGDMERDLGRIEETVRRLVRYARPLEPHRQRVRLAQVIEGAVRIARGAPGARGRTIAVAELDPTLELRVDPALIEQVLVNLLVNACEASSAGAEVLLRATRDGKGALVSVEDHGSGLAPEHRERLFRPFFTTKPGGNGLGLAVSRNIVQEHGGKIDAQAGAGGGTVFRVFLPVGEEPWPSPS